MKTSLYNEGAKPPGITPQGPCILRGIFLNQIRGRLSLGEGDTGQIDRDLRGILHKLIGNSDL